MLRHCPAKKLEKIRKDFGILLSVFVNDTGSMRSQTHVEWFHSDPLAKAMQRARKLGKTPDAAGAGPNSLPRFCP